MWKSPNSCSTEMSAERGGWRLMFDLCHCQRTRKGVNTVTAWKVTKSNKYVNCSSATFYVKRINQKLQFYQSKIPLEPWVSCRIIHFYVTSRQTFKDEAIYIFTHKHTHKKKGQYHRNAAWQETTAWGYVTISRFTTMDYATVWTT